jgi:uncharacterized SAM-binding protein YcdF (DUF218 family)
MVDALVRIHRWLPRFLTASLALPAVYFGALAAAGPLFELRTAVTPVDVIVVLGGDGPSRAAKAAAVYRSIAPAAPIVLISGDADCVYIAKAMIDDGVPSRRITLECASGNTWENAKFSRPLLEQMGAHSAILVTSWFHVRRAIGCFRAFNPEILWGSAPVERRRPLWEIAGDIEGFEAAKEYLKIAWYAVRYGLLETFARSMESREWSGR